MTAKTTLELDGEVSIIRFSNPPDGYMTDDTSIGLLNALDQIKDAGGIKVVILTGADPGVFIRHFDVKTLEERGRALRDKGIVFSLDRMVPEAPLHEALHRIEAAPQVFIAALNGTAMGGGFEISLACDIRLAEAGEHWLGLPESNVGLLPGAGGTQRLPRLIGQAKALEFILKGQTVRPETAAEIGLVSEVTEGPVLERARILATELCEKPSKALAHIKRLVRDTENFDGFGAERTLFCDLMVSDEAIDLMHSMNTGGDIRNPRKR